jgi:hypothetical protein
MSFRIAGGCALANVKRKNGGRIARLAKTGPVVEIRRRLALGSAGGTPSQPMPVPGGHRLLLVASAEARRLNKDSTDSLLAW